MKICSYQGTSWDHYYS